MRLSDETLLLFAVVGVFGASIAVAGQGGSSQHGIPLSTIHCTHGRRTCYNPFAEYTLRIHTNIVSLAVLVPTAIGLVFTSMGKRNFRVFEDEIEQVVTHLGSLDAPLSIDPVIDASGTMGGKLIKSRHCPKTFFASHNDCLL